MTTHIVEVEPNVGHVDSREDYEAQLERLEACYDKVAVGTDYTFEVRTARRGEADGTYVEMANGNLQILGYSSPIPDDLEDLMDRAWNLFCTPEVTP